MKLLICTAIPILSTSATKNRLGRMCKALAAQGIETILVGSGQGINQPWREQEVNDTLCIAYDAALTGVTRYCRTMTIGAQSAKFYRDHLPDLLIRYDCDGVIVYASQAQIAEAVLEAAHSVDRLVFGDLVERFQISPYYLANGLFFDQRRLVRSILPRMDGLIGISRGWCEWARERGIPNVWIPSFAHDHGCVRRESSPPGSPFTVAFIGHWIRREKPIVFLEAMRICLKSGLNIRMVAIGNIGQHSRERGAMRFLRRDPVLQKHVSFHGFVSDEEKDRQLADADAFIILRPDNRETDMLFPTRLPEYLLTGSPVILSKVGSFPHCFKHRNDVWFVSKENRPEEVAEAFMHLAAHPKERLEIGRRGRQSALDQFSLEVLGERLAIFLRTIASGDEFGRCERSDGSSST